MCSESPALVVREISKCYHIYRQPADRLKQLLIAPLYDLFRRTGKKRYYQEFHALRNVSFAINKGETVGIIGRNGAGKSTLLQIISGVLSPTSGLVDLNGRVAALLELGSSFNPEFTGIENIYLYGAIFGLEKEEMDKRLEDICRFAEIGDYVHQPIKVYSTGMVLRLAFAVIAHVDADILIIDEALTVGDAFYVQKCMRFLKNFMKNGTILLVSHDTSAVVNLCSRVIWLEKGAIRMHADPKSVSERYLADLAKRTQKDLSLNAAYTDTGENNRRSRNISAHTADTDTRDMRADFINSTNLRNDLEVFRFNEDAPAFGQRLASITNVTMTDIDGKVLTWIVGGEEVRLCITCEAHDSLESPIVGFYVKDRLGQHLFGDNTFLTYEEDRPSIEAGRIFQALFRFRMPALPVGEYTIAPAVAVGSQDDHSTQHWLHDALLFKSHSSSVINCLLGIPMTEIEINIQDRTTGKDS